MGQLRFNTQELPEMEGLGARFVVVATTLDWRDGEITNDRRQIPRIQRELRKRWFNRLTA